MELEACQALGWRPATAPVPRQCSDKGTVAGFWEAGKGQTVFGTQVDVRASPVGTGLCPLAHVARFEF